MTNVCQKDCNENLWQLVRCGERGMGRKDPIRIMEEKISPGFLNALKTHPLCFQKDTPSRYKDYVGHCFLCTAFMFTSKPVLPPDKAQPSNRDDFPGFW